MTSNLSRFGLVDIEETIKPRYNFSDPNALREQIKKEFGPAEDENRSPALDDLTGSASSSLTGFFAQAWPEPPLLLWSVAAEGENALGLLPSFAQQPIQPRTPQPLRDEETDALGLFTPEPKETHQTPEISLSGFGSPLVPESSASLSGEVNQGNPLGLFTPKVEGASPQTRNSSIEDPDSPSPLDNLGKDVVGPQTPAFGWQVPTRNTTRPFVPRTLISSGYLQLEHTMTERRKVNEDIQVADERQLRPPEFFDLAIHFVCCYGPLETLRVLIQEKPRLAPDLTLETYIPVALAAGNGDITLALLESGAKISQKNNPYLLYQLHHLPAQQVEPVARAIVSKGFDPNEKVELHKDTRFAGGRLSVFLDHVRGRSITPLRWAPHHGNEIVVKVLLDLGAEFARLPDVDTCVAHGGPVDRLEIEAFTVAVLEESRFNMNILEMFFRRHGNQLGKAVFSETPLGLIAMEPDYPERRLRFYGVRGEIENLHQVLSLLRKYQRDSDAQLFWAAAMNGHKDIHLLHRLPPQLSGFSEAGSPPPLLINLPDADGDTPLHYAALFDGGRNTRAVDRLLAIGADPTARNARGMVPGVIRARYFAWKGAATLRAAVPGKGRGEGDGGIINDDRGGDGGRWGRKYLQLLPMERFAAATSSPPGAEGGSCSSDVGRDGRGEQEHDGGEGHQSMGGSSTTTYWDGKTASSMRPREFGEEDGEGNEVKMMGQLLHGARVKEVWDLHVGRWVRFEKEMVVQLVTEADMRTDFAKKNVID
ncbi:hypothetical protein C7999DRAFT_34174 [Corynascus novoguineensis]|uniref:Ankyrin n=1 Tax=Corynascus novoguineensis TaxID=1126955 RepID=A0AAN7CNR9_9PEZI|nr:hypothetical protein C7999DRAFT_34174 [Corynascus novoguineensis]